MKFLYCIKTLAEMCMVMKRFNRPPCNTPPGKDGGGGSDLFVKHIFRSEINTCNLQTANNWNTSKAFSGKYVLSQQLLYFFNFPSSVKFSHSCLVKIIVPKPLTHSARDTMATLLQVLFSN